MSDYIVVHGIRIAKTFEPETFGRLTTIGPRFLVPVGSGFFVAKQVCICQCGNMTITSTNDMRTGTTKSCGCLSREKARQKCIETKTKHGMAGTPTYTIWKGLKKRCYNEKTEAYRNYGGRGIRVCDRWLDPENGFVNFLEDMGERPSDNHEVDRYPNQDGNYEPGNCRWATHTEQARNKRNNKLLTHNGKTQCVAAWAEELGMRQTTISDRLRRGWSVEKTLTAPKQSNRYY
jgi:hypothetical protein